MIAKAFGSRRVGGISPAALVTIPLLLLAAGVALYVCLVREAHAETQNAADAAALAAALALASDDLLVENIPERERNRLAQARAAAVTLGKANFAAGERLTLDPDRDVVFGNLDRPLFGAFDATIHVPSEVNAAQVTLRRGSIRAPLGGTAPDKEVLGRATAMLDWCVIGFRPKDDAPIPLMPIAILTDHMGKLPHGWDAQLAAARAEGNDEMVYDPTLHHFVPGSDGIPEVTVILGPRGKADPRFAPPAILLQVGVDSFAETVLQVRAGTLGADLAKKFGADFVLGVDNTLHIPGTPECPRLGSVGRELLDEAFRALRDSGEARVWPLFTEVAPNSEAVRVSGWMAARVVAVLPAHGGGIKLILQPAVVCHPSVVTEQRESRPAFWAGNRTVCRVRLAG